MAHNFVLQLCFAIVLVTNVVSGDALLINGSIYNHTDINHDATAPVDDTTQVNDTAPVDDATQVNDTTPVDDATPDPKLSAQLEKFWRQEKRFVNPIGVIQKGIQKGIHAGIGAVDNLIGASDQESTLYRLWQGPKALKRAFDALTELIDALKELKSIYDHITGANERRGIARRQVEGLGSLVARRGLEKRTSMPFHPLVRKDGPQADESLKTAVQAYEKIGGALEELGVKVLSKETQKKKKRKKKNRQSKEQVQPDGVDSTPTEDVKVDALPSWLLEGEEALTTALNASETLKRALNELESLQRNITEIIAQNKSLEVNDATRDRRASAHLGKVQRRMEMFEESLEAIKRSEKRAALALLGPAVRIAPTALKAVKTVLPLGLQAIESVMMAGGIYEWVGGALGELVGLQRRDTQSQERVQPGQYEYEYEYYDSPIITTTLVDSTTTRDLEASARKGEASTIFKIRPSVVLVLAALVVPLFLF